MTIKFHLQNDGDGENRKGEKVFWTKGHCIFFIHLYWNEQNNGVSEKWKIITHFALFYLSSWKYCVLWKELFSKYVTLESLCLIRILTVCLCFIQILTAFMQEIIFTFQRKFIYYIKRSVPAGVCFSCIEICSFIQSSRNYKCERHKHR